MTRTVVVTGSASGIGRATAELLRRDGARVIGVDLRDAEVIADLGTAEGRAAMLEQVAGLAGGRLDGLVASAGIALEESQTLAVNVFGGIATLDGLLPLLERGDQPRAVVLSSIVATTNPDEGLVELCLAGDEPGALAAAEGKAPAIYASSKAALARWVRREAAAWAERGVLLNAAAPGLIATPMTNAMIEDPATLAFIKQVVPMPIGRHGQPGEVAELIAFLASPRNSFMVGQIIFIDGGAEVTNRGAHAL
ncbi:MAG TPA: SDR family oxidoreductase [Herpetosiphonaceae bacterium]